MTDRTEEFRAKYQRKPEGNGGTFSFKPSAHAKAEKPVYQAFGTERQRQVNLWIRPNSANEETDLSIPYGYHKSMITDGGGFHISIFVNDDSILQIEIQGRNLGPQKGEPAPDSEDDTRDLWRKLLRGEVIWIQEFDPRQWDAPSDGAAVIAAIKVHRRAVVQNSEEMLPGEKRAAGTTGRRH
jgi:hypothetical protein